MFRNNISVYVDDEEMAKKVRGYAQKLRQERGQRTYTKPMQDPSQIEPKTPVYMLLPKEAQEINTDIGAVNTWKMPKLPAFLLDVMNGLSYPNQEDLTREEQQILYDPAINGLVNEYRATKSPATALMIEERLKEIRG